MKKHFFKLPVSWPAMFALLVATTLIFGQSDELSQSAVTSPAVVGSLSPFIPSTIAYLPIEDPRTTFRVRIGPEGQLLDRVCLKASHHRLVEPAIRALEKAEFTPGKDAGVPFTSEVDITIHFARGLVADQSVGDHAESMQYKLDPDRYVYQRTHPGKLDEPLAIAAQGTVMVPIDEAGNPIEGEAKVEFYVDHEGVPRMLRLLSADTPVIGEAALQTFTSFRFTAPRKEGIPTVVKVRMPFAYP